MSKKWEAVVSAGIVYVRDNQTNIGVCVVGHGEPTQEEKANAALIAAAPKMLDLLIEIRKTLGKTTFPTEKELSDICASITDVYQQTKVL